MRINNNISALRANTNLSRVDKRLSQSTERLSSGNKINAAADDAAGFSISRRMRTQIKSLERASRNSADGISVIQTAEGALNEVSAILIRMKELAIQAANDTYSGEDRDAIQKEIDELNNEIDRISGTTGFNTKNLLNGEVGRKSVTKNEGVDVLRSTDVVPHGKYKLNVTGDPKKAVYEGGTVDEGAFGEDSNIAGKIIINGEVITINKGESFDSVRDKLIKGAERAGLSLIGNGGGPSADGNELYGGYNYEKFDGGASLLLVSKEYGSKAKIDIKVVGTAVKDKDGTVLESAEDNAANLAAALGLPTEMDKPERGSDTTVELGEGFSKTATVRTDGDKVIVKDNGGFEMELKVKNYTTENDKGGEVDLTVLDAGYMTMQVGANTGDSFDVSIGRIDSETLGLKGLNLRTREEAARAISRVDIAISRVSGERAKLGAYQNRFEHTMLSLDETTENMTSAFSRIMDTDMAEEMTEYTQQKVLSQAGTSVLAQANERPNTILTLLQS
ncbi:MAG: flagellin N-terminal helical domain-containing protein [Catonella sp.]|uniref:flagellin N-terminal helical domain-containing protein n=1 Tax=Catonella sp. TaxID=2382125 RepID=UPI003F9ED0D5